MLAAKLPLRFLIWMTFLSVLVVWAWMQGFEYHTSSGGWSTQAKRNPLLAVQQLQGQQGRAVTTYAGVTQMQGLPDTDATLLILGGRYGVSPQQQQQWLQWVRAGGHLILELRQEFNEQRQYSGDGLADQLGLQLWPAAVDVVGSGACASAAVVEPDQVDDLLPSPYDPFELPPKTMTPAQQLRHDYCAYSETGLLIHWHQQSYRLQNAHSQRLLASEPMASDQIVNWQASNAAGVQMLQLTLGDGRLTVATELDWLGNASLLCLDHNQFAWQLLQSPGELWLVYRDDMPSLWILLWAQWPWLSAAVMLLMALALWRHWHWLGLPQREPAASAPVQNPLQAIGAWHWRHGQQQVLHRAVLSHTFQQLARRHPGIELASDEPLTDDALIHLAQLAGLSTAQIAVLQQVATDQEAQARQFAIAQRLLELGSPSSQVVN